MKLLDLFAPRCKVKFSGLKEGMTILVRKGFKENGLNIERSVKGTYYLREGVYSFHLSGEGYCEIHKVFTISTSDLGNEIIITVPEIEVKNTEAEFSGCLFLYSDELEENLYSVKKLKEFDKALLDTPAFSSDKSMIQFTTNKEKREYVRKAVAGCEYAHMEENNYMFPVVFFTKEKRIKGMSSEEIIQIMRKSDKLNVLYHAQLHGLEMPAGEGALIIVKALSGKLGETLLKKLNIIVVPCVNQKGNTAVTRECEGIDLNRDFLQAQTEEVRELHKIFYKLRPEVTIDGHTWTRANSIKGNDLRKSLLDVRASAGNTLNMDERIVEINETMASYVQTECRKVGLRTGYYDGSINRAASKTYYSLSPCCSITYETEGTRSGKYHFERNVWAQYKGITSILEYICENSEVIKKTICDVRQNLKNGIRPFGDRFVVKQTKSGREYYTSYVDNYNFFGEMIEKDAGIYHWIYDLPEEEIRIPNAFIIKKCDVNDGWLEFFREIHGIDVEEKVTECAMEVVDFSNGEANIVLQNTEIFYLPTAQEQIYMMMALFTEKNLCIKMKEDSSVYFI